MTGVIATNPRFQFSNATGTPLANGNLTTYLAGTTTLATTWQDSALSAANTNPIVLDSRGECVIYLDSTKNYKFVLKNSASVTQWTQDNISGADSGLRGALAASSGSSLVGFVQPGTGAVARTVQTKLRESVSVLDFGANIVPGATPMATAIQAALNSGLGDIHIPDGDYLIDADLTVPDSVCIYFDKGAVFKASANGRTFFKSTTTAYFSQVHNAVLDGNGKTGVTGFDMTNMRLQAGIFEPRFKDMTNGIIFRYGCFGTHIRNPTTFNNVPFPIRLIDSNANVLITNPNFDNTSLLTGTGILIEAGTTATTVGVIVDGGYIQGFVTGISDAGWGTKIKGTYFEQCSATDILATSARNFIYEGTQHPTTSGNSGIQGINCDGGLVIAPLMTSGGRSTGLFNFNGTNTNCYYVDTKSNASLNTPLGVVAGIRSIWGSPQAIGDVSPSTGAFTTLSSTGLATLAQARTAIGNASIATATPTTIFTPSGGNRGIYRFVALVVNSGGPTQYCASASVYWDGTGARITADNGANLTLTLSGAAVQMTQTSGFTQTVYWSYLYQSI